MIGGGGSSPSRMAVRTSIPAEVRAAVAVSNGSAQLKVRSRTGSVVTSRR
jgi:hypothetical protein